MFGTWSLSARRAWIEISISNMVFGCAPVALRKESVDRNIQHAPNMPGVSVALRKESVDRNQNVSSGMPKCQVALRKESVDRN